MLAAAGALMALIYINILAYGKNYINKSFLLTLMPK